MDRKKIIIGLTGKVGSGKGTILEILKEKGFFATSISDCIREEVRERGEEITRDKLQDVGDEKRGKFGPSIWAEKTWEKVISQECPNAVIDSIRAEAEADFLKSHNNFTLIGVMAPAEVRFQRIKERGRESDPKTFKEFIAVENKDIKSGIGDEGRDINRCLEKADFVVENNGTIEELKEKIEKVLNKLL